MTRATPTKLQESSARSAELLSKKQLREALDLPSTRIIDEWVRKRKISFLRLGHRTLRFSLAQVLEDLSRFEVKAVGRTKEGGKK